MKNQFKNASNSFLTLIVLPLILGLIMYAVLISMINGEIIKNEIAIRYLTGHPVSLFTTAMFCIGVAALLLTAKSVFDQNWLRKKISLGKVGEDKESDYQTDAEMAQACQDHLVLMPRKFREFFLWNRLVAVLESIKRNEGTENLDDELKYLAESDLDRQSERFALVRILIWATPMLGFLGTVIGISQALGSINVGADNDFQQMLGGLRESLYVAFDTTALALTFSILLMFGQFVTDRFDSQLLEGVDGQSRSELDRHFDFANPKRDPEYKLLEKIGDQIAGSMEYASQNQIEIWSESMIQANEQWRENAKEMNRQWNDAHRQITQDHHWPKMKEQWEQIQQKWTEVHTDLRERWSEIQQQRQQGWSESGEMIQQQLVEAIGQATREWHEGIGQTSRQIQDGIGQASRQIHDGIGQHLQAAEEQLEHRWQQLQVSMSDSARLVRDQQAELRLQTESMTEAMTEIANLLAVASQKTDAADEQEPLRIAISSLVESLSRHQEVQAETIRSAQQTQQRQLADVTRQLGEFVAELQKPEPPTPNQELKLRIIRPAA